MARIISRREEKKWVVRGLNYRGGAKGERRRIEEKLSCTQISFGTRLGI